jgi:hypothetical protein
MLLSIRVILLLVALQVSLSCYFVDVSDVNDTQQPCVPKSPITARLHQLLRSVTTSSQPTEARNGFTSQAIRAANSQNLKEALANFRAASHYKPHESQMMANLALILRDTALSLLEKRKKKLRKTAWRMLCEAVAAYEMVFYLKNKPIADRGSMRATYSLLKHVHNLLDSNFPGRCHSIGVCDRYELIRRGMDLELSLKSFSSFSTTAATTTTEISSIGETSNDDDSGENTFSDNAERQGKRHIKAVNLICSGEDSLRISLDESDRRRGTPSIFFSRRIYATMRICGAVAVPNLWTLKAMKPLVQAQHQVLDDFMNHGDRSGARGGNKVSEGGKIDGDDEDDEFENSQAATRSKSRFEIKLPLSPPFTDNGFVDNRWLVYILKLIMSDRILIDTFSFVTSLGHAPEQHWHNDVSGLFTSKHDNLPPQSLVAVIPFNAMNATTGPTEHRLGSHVQMGGGYWEKFDMKDVSGRFFFYYYFLLLYLPTCIH